MKQNATTIKVAFYIRVSTDDQVEKFGIPLQRDALEGLLKSRGKLQDGTNSMQLAGEKYVYIDEGVSGTVPLEQRPAFLKLKEDIALSGEVRPFEAVAVYKIDRFARRLKILLDVVDFFELNEIDFMSANESIDTSTPFGKAMLNIIGVIAELEIETTKKRTQDGRAQALKEGIVMGASAQYGYKKGLIDGKLEVLKPEAEIVIKIYEYFVADRMSAYEIALKLGEEGIISPSVSAIENEKRKGKVNKKNSITHWKPEKIREILGNEIYIGKYYYSKKIKGVSLAKSKWTLSEKSHEPIIDQPSFEAAQKLLEQSKHETRRKGEHIYLLSGLLKCNQCFNPLTDKNMSYWIGNRKEVGKGTGNFTYHYKCGRKNPTKSDKLCAVIPLPAKEIEDYITTYTLELLRNPEVVYKHNERLASSKKELQKLQKESVELEKILNSLENQRNNVLEQHKMGHIGNTKLQDQLNDNQSRKVKIQVKKGEVDSGIAQQTDKSTSLATLQLFATKYKDFIEKAKINREAMYEIIHHLFEEIVIYSRDTTEKDVVAGVKKPNQKMPNKIHFKLRLPKEIIREVGQVLPKNPQFVRR